MSALPCSGCGHPYRDHFAGGTCITRHNGEASVCPCLAWGAAPRETTTQVPYVPERTPEPGHATQEQEPPKWFDVLLACAGCDRKTYRPPLSRDGCVWCGGALLPYTARPELAAAA